MSLEHHQPHTHRPPGTPADHTHGDAHTSSHRLFIALVVTTAFMVVEIIGGVLSGSLALLADAAHMATDASMLLVSWWAVRLGMQPADARHSYGHTRYPVLAAFVNGIALLALSGWIVVEAVQRVFQPVSVLPKPLLIVATLGLVVNLLMWLYLKGIGHSHGHGASGHNLNVESAAAHVLSDALGSIAAVAAGVIVMYTGWVLADPLLSLVVAIVMIPTGVRITKQSGHILLEGVPGDLDLEVIADDLRHVSGVGNVHHLHAWTLDSAERLMTLHVQVTPEAEADSVLRAVQARLTQRFRITHATIQMERRCSDAPAIDPVASG